MSSFQTSSGDSIRAFIAINLPENVISKIRDVQEQLKKYKIKISWTKPENIHLTLKFLGDIQPESIESIERVIEESIKACHPMELFSRAIGFFPSVKRPRVLWMGLLGQTEELALLQQKIDIGLSALDFPLESKSFTGHLTLGRLKAGGTPEVFIDIMKSFQEISTDRFVADSVNLYKSRLTPSGPIYTKLFSTLLKTEF